MISVGDWLVCIDASPAFGRAVPLVKGEVYQVEEVHGDLPHGNGEVGLGDLWVDVGIDLVGVERVLLDICYGAHRFRPMDPQKAPEKALETAA